MFKTRVISGAVLTLLTIGILYLGGYVTGVAVMFLSLGGVFELLARGAVVMLVLRLGGGYVSTCLSDPAAWVSALIPLIPYYFYKMRKYSSLQEKKTVL